MGLKLIQKQEGQSLNLCEVKAYLRVQHDLEDELLKRFVEKALAWVEESTGKTLL